MLDFPYNLEQLFKPLENYKHIALAVSGGSDSLALMLLVSAWSKTQKSAPKIDVYTVNHALREQAQDECKFVEREAKKLAFNSYILTWEGKKPTSALQANARKARYQLIGEAMAKTGAEILLTAHHAFDQAETIMMRLKSGSGIAGLKGISKFSVVERVKIYRPLLEISPDILANVAKNAEINPIIDPSNSDENYERVRWRKILPKLFDLGLTDKRFAKFSARIGRADFALNEITNSLFEDKVELDKFGVAQISLLDLSLTPMEIQLRLLQKLLQKIGGKQKPFALSQIEELHCKIMMGDSFVKQTLHGCVISKKKNIFIFMREVSKLPNSPQIVKINEKIIWDNRFEIKNFSSDNIEIISAIKIKKIQLEDFLGKKNITSISHILGAPVILDKNSEIIAVGLNIKTKEIDIKML